ncbi:hypothetical protein T4C_6471 [Trichinella pseudospiralis]|uniref:Uncharacterized protein n=1 Tax=Trichinella pseudospiralis TaxID=6337 RepID=A0A0V1GN07_TRIPS|nr:hypothetical protein T4C_6471 [Trichinella pseudospiralis]
MYLIAVSYTHLDVYKRQSLDFENLNCGIQLYGHKALTNSKVENGHSSPEDYTDHGM